MKKVIVTSFDINYFNYSKVTLKSLAQNYHGKDKLDIVCLVPKDILHLENEYAQSIAEEKLNIKFRSSNAYEKMLQNGLAHASSHITSHCNHRIFLGSVCHDYDIAIYIDSDTIIRRDIEPLLNFKLRNMFMAVQEHSDMSQISFGDKDRPYFNNGIFIANLNFWRQFNAESKMVDWISNNGPTLCPEQDAMNAVFIDWWSPLPISFNMFDWFQWVNEHASKTNSDPLIVHFSGEQKPWLGENGSRYNLEWRKIYLDLV